MGANEMPTLTMGQAVELLTSRIESDLAVEDLLWIHNEIFPEEPVTDEEIDEDYSPVLERIVAYINDDGDLEGLVGVWELAFWGVHSDIMCDLAEQTIAYEKVRGPGRSS